MKLSLLNSLCILGLSVSTIHAQTVLINNTTRNGSFEIAADGDPFGGADNQVNNLEFWTTTASPVGTNGMDRNQARNNKPVTQGSYRANLGESNSGPKNGLFMDTGYTVLSGDTFDLSFYYIPAYEWDTGDVLEVFLYTEANAATPIYSGTVTNVGNTDVPSNFSVSGIGNVNAADIGENLVIEFNYSVNPDGYIGIDEVALSVIPEPTSYALVTGVVLLGLAYVRRRTA